jgi:cephalosporin hydroxylase
MGRPIIQHPEDTVRLQEVIYFLKPDVIIETGVAHGGSLIFYASLLKAMGNPRRGISLKERVKQFGRTTRCWSFWIRITATPTFCMS